MFLRKLPFEFATLLLAARWQDVPADPNEDIAPDGRDGIVNEFDPNILLHRWLQ